MPRLTALFNAVKWLKMAHRSKSGKMAFL